MHQQKFPFPLLLSVSGAAIGGLVAALAAGISYMYLQE